MKAADNEQNPIMTLTFAFALNVMAYTKVLEQNRHFVLANQLVRSGTAIGALVREAQHAESRSDFIHKMKVAAKEAEETDYWLLLCEHSPDYPEVPNLRAQLEPIRRMLGKIIVTSKANSGK